MRVLVKGTSRALKKTRPVQRLLELPVLAQGRRAPGSTALEEQVLISGSDEFVGRLGFLSIGKRALYEDALYGAPVFICGDRVMMGRPEGHGLSRGMRRAIVIGAGYSWKKGSHVKVWILAHPVGGGDDGAGSDSIKRPSDE
ncbi:MAG: hypothetical protein M1832_002212 [Thelocarpon impressellum]|nr:MAG: hypothetical protein M1832_002212 [Thelocarpon impressellum]